MVVYQVFTNFAAKIENLEKSQIVRKPLRGIATDYDYEGFKDIYQVQQSGQLFTDFSVGQTYQQGH